MGLWGGPPKHEVRIWEDDRHIWATHSDYNEETGHWEVHDMVIGDKDDTPPGSAEEA